MARTWSHKVARKFAFKLTPAQFELQSWVSKIYSRFLDQRSTVILRRSESLCQSGAEGPEIPSGTANLEEEVLRRTTRFDRGIQFGLNELLVL